MEAVERMNREFKIIPRRLKQKGALTAGLGSNPGSRDSPSNVGLCFGKRRWCDDLSFVS